MSSWSEKLNHFMYGEQNRTKNHAMAGILKYQMPELEWYSVFNPDAIPVDPTVIWGIDLSGYWNGVPDYKVFKARGGKFVFIKAADGTTYTKLFKENVLAAQAEGLIVGAYFWLYRNERISGRAQATAWWNIVKDMALDFYVVDMEWTRWMGKLDNPNTSDLYGAVVPFQQLSGKKMWVYSSTGYMAQFFNGNVFFKDNPFIIANYGVTVPGHFAPWGVNGHTIWQCSESWPGAPLGFDPLASNFSDGDIFNGDQAKFDALFGGVPVPPPTSSDLSSIVVANKDGSHQTFVRRA